MALPGSAMKKVLTTRLIDALQPAPAGTTYDVTDAIVPGLAVRVMDTGVKSFVLVTRLPGASNPTRRAIAKVGAIELTQARSRAREWLSDIAQGIDPKTAAAARMATDQASAFGPVVERY